MHAISTTCTTISFFQNEQHMLILNDEPGGPQAPLKHQSATKFNE
jgi:hypothetical protein